MLDNQQTEQSLLKDVLSEHITEQRRARRWGIFFKLLILAYLVAFPLFLWIDAAFEPEIKKQNGAAVINVYGPIFATEQASAENIIESLEKAFRSHHVKGIILKINSPGGSPVQARYIYDAIRTQKEKFKKPVFAVIEDLGTSAAYLIASAADSIYADQTGLVGSIGVIINSFGFVDSMEKLGIERRLYSAGKHKGILDPFSPRKPDEEAFIQTQLESIHRAFINNVKEGRGDRLKETENIFSGLFWGGEQAYQLGLIDGFGSAKSVAMNKLDTELLIDFNKRRNLLDKLASRLGAFTKLELKKLTNFLALS